MNECPGAPPVRNPNGRLRTDEMKHGPKHSSQTGWPIDLRETSSKIVHTVYK
jgi:hypothetical protein